MMHPFMFVSNMKSNKYGSKSQMYMVYLASTLILFAGFNWNKLRLFVGEKKLVRSKFLCFTPYNLKKEPGRSVHTGIELSP